MYISTLTFSLRPHSNLINLSELKRLATLPDAATAASWNASRCCNCCFLAPATLLQRYQTLQLLLSGPCNASATLPEAAPQRARNLHLLPLELMFESD